MNEITDENKINARNYWKIAPGEQAKDWTNQNNQNVIAIEWNDTGDLSGLTQKEIHQRILDKFPSSIGSVGPQFKNFLKIKKGDMIIANKGKSRIVGLGEVTGNYQYRPDQKYAHAYPVNWFWSGEREIQSQNNWHITVVPVPHESFNSISKDFTQDMNLQIELNLKDNLKQNVKINTDYSRHVEILKRKKNIILYGPPGTGKTYAAKKIAKMITNLNNSTIITNSNDLTKNTNPNQLKRTWKAAATLVLIENFGRPMHYKTITNKIKEKNLYETKSSDPSNTLNAILNDNMQKYGNESFFRRTGEGSYGLNTPMTFKNASEMILRAKNEQMWPDQIAKIINDLKLVDFTDEISGQKISDVLTHDIQNNDKSIFVQIKEGVHGVRELYYYKNHDQDQNHDQK